MYESSIKPWTDFTPLTGVQVNAYLVLAVPNTRFRLGLNIPEELNNERKRKVMDLLKTNGCESIELVKNRTVELERSHFTASLLFENPLQALQIFDRLENEKIHDGCHVHFEHQIIMTLSYPSFYMDVFESCTKEAQEQNHSAQFKVDVHETSILEETTLKISGSGNLHALRAMARIKTLVEKYMIGTVGGDTDGYSLWIPIFTKEDFKPYAKFLSTKRNVYIKVNELKKQVLVFGTAEKKDKVVRDIQLAANSLSVAKHVSGSQLSTALELQVSAPDISRRHGTMQDTQIIHSVLSNLTQPPPPSESSSYCALVPAYNRELKFLPNCVRCWTELDDSSAKFTCGHRYCKECLLKKCRDPQTWDFPLRCDEPGCEVSFSMEDLAANIPLKVLENLLETSFNVWFLYSPENGGFGYCRGPDCNTLYRLSSSTGPRFCTGCLQFFCNRNGHLKHHSPDCQQRPDPKSNESITRNDIKLCPTCSTPIEHTRSCNTVLCRCGAAIFLVCLRIFTTEEKARKHLAADHQTLEIATEYVFSRRDLVGLRAMFPGIPLAGVYKLEGRHINGVPLDGMVLGNGVIRFRSPSCQG
ncbi:hypothetical protein G7Y89_g2846 [Cudoniella acicularis]|uniref:RING-type domain-containing protein n=1 Tax=Cudoniella acicularis TaxID=354080 RepID=A0A8H4RUL2_9HELO|nr:hypothetical protein G7Y89_g2846 [Cudoniella acicularis]